MEPRDKKPADQQPAAKPEQDKENAAAAYKQADSDISKDPDLSIHHPNDDLDEGESARLGKDKTDLV